MPEESDNSDTDSTDYDTSEELDKDLYRRKRRTRGLIAIAALLQFIERMTNSFIVFSLLWSREPGSYFWARFLAFFLFMPQIVFCFRDAWMNGISKLTFVKIISNLFLVRPILEIYLLWDVLLPPVEHRFHRVFSALFCSIPCACIQLFLLLISPALEGCIVCYISVISAILSATLSLGWSGTLLRATTTPWRNRIMVFVTILETISARILCLSLEAFVLESNVVYIWIPQIVFGVIVVAYNLRTFPIEDNPLGRIGLSSDQNPFKIAYSGIVQAIVGNSGYLCPPIDKHFYWTGDLLSYISAMYAFTLWDLGNPFRSVIETLVGVFAYFLSFRVILRMHILQPPHIRPSFLVRVSIGAWVIVSMIAAHFGMYQTVAAALALGIAAYGIDKKTVEHHFPSIMLLSASLYVTAFSILILGPWLVYSLSDYVQLSGITIVCMGLGSLIDLWTLVPDAGENFLL